MSHEILAIFFCKAWNNLDASYLENRLTDDFVYSSQMVLADLYGQKEYINYIKAKFNAFKKGVNTVTAELGYYENEPCFFLTVTFATSIRAPFGIPEYKSPTHPLVKKTITTVLLKFEHDLIKSAILCVVTNASVIKRTGVYPK